MNPGAIILAHLTEPTEKYWGQLIALDAAGVTLRGLNLQSFDDWLIEVASGEAPAIGPTTVFFPLRRIDCLFLDEAIGPVQSFAERLEDRVGQPASVVLSAGEAPPADAATDA